MKAWALSLILSMRAWACALLRSSSTLSRAFRIPFTRWASRSLLDIFGGSGAAFFRGLGLSFFFFLFLASPPGFHLPSAARGCEGSKPKCASRASNSSALPRGTSMCSLPHHRLRRSKWMLLTGSASSSISTIAPWSSSPSGSVG